MEKALQIFQFCLSNSIFPNNYFESWTSKLTVMIFHTEGILWEDIE